MTRPRSPVRVPLLVALVVTVLGVASPVSAALDPDRAEADVQAVVAAHDYSFCTKPDDPLSPHARDLCPLADAIPGCTALVEACAKEDKPFELGPFWERVARFLGRAAPFVAWGLIAVFVGVVAYFVARAVRAAREAPLPPEELSAADVTLLADFPEARAAVAPEDLLRRAADARARGDARTALFTYLAAALRALDDRGAIRLARDRTNGEYVRACQDEGARTLLREMVREVDAVQFGGGDATPERVAVAEGRALRIVRPAGVVGAAGIATLLIGVLALGTGACRGGLDAFSHDDPAGHGLLADLLERQGVTVENVPGSLAQLPMKGAQGPVVVLDVDRVPLEDDTRAHLVAWVQQGGALVLAGAPSRWPSEFWAKGCPVDAPTTSGLAALRVETRSRPAALEDDDDDDDAATLADPGAPVHVHRATLAHRVTLTWPSDDRAPRAIAKLDDGELYGALRAFGRGKVLGLASAELLSNVSLAVPGNAAAVVAMLGALDREEFAIARSEQGVSPPESPLAGLLHVGLGPALVHALFFVPLLFVAYGARQAAPRSEPPSLRRAFAEHVRAVGALYARTRAAPHALAVYAKHVDDRLRAAMGRGGDPVAFLAARSGVSRAEAAQVHARALEVQPDGASRGDELRVLQRLSVLYLRAISKR